MNTIPNACRPLPLDLDSLKTVRVDAPTQGDAGRAATAQPAIPCTVQRRARPGSVTSRSAAATASPRPRELAHYDQQCHANRFHAWLHGSRVLQAPLPACQLDSADNEAQALASQLRAVRETSYLPARTPVLFM